MNKRDYFLSVFRRAEKKYGKHDKRLAGDDWPHAWQTLIATIMSAQTRDEVTIPVAEGLFARYISLDKLAHARENDVLNIIKRVNFSKTKAKNVVTSARYLMKYHRGLVPDSIEELIKLPGVGRKTANLVLSECHAQQGITVDTHVHRIANVFGFVTTKTPTQTEFALRKLVPSRYWSRINRIFVLWGKDVRGYDKKKFLAKLKE
ncbi:MAG: endonuclease III [Nanoarchaeota archaeon]